jgi:hypothetical protein
VARVQALLGLKPSGAESVHKAEPGPHDATDPAAAPILRRAP